MTKKQRQQVAKMWAGAILSNVGMDSFNNDTSYEDAGAIVQMVHEFGRNILKDCPNMGDLEEIIEYTIPQKDKLKKLFAQADDACNNLKDLFGKMKGRKICGNCGIDYAENEPHKCPE